MEASLVSEWQRLISRGVLCCIVALLLIIAIGVHQHPNSVFPGDLSALAVTVVAIVFFCVMTVCTLYAKTPSMQTALLVGASVGAIQGFIEIANIVFEYSSFGSSAIHTFAVPLSMALMILLFSGAGSLTYDRTCSLRLGALGGVWCAVVGTLITGLFGFAYNFVQMPHLVEIMQSRFALSSLPDPQTYVVRNTIDSASTHFLLAPMLGLIAGSIGGFVSSQLRERPRWLAVVVSFMSLGLLACFVEVIRFGLSLARADRAPSISAGMIGSALALTVLWPATRRAFFPSFPAGVPACALTKGAS